MANLLNWKKNLQRAQDRQSAILDKLIASKLQIHCIYQFVHLQTIADHTVCD